MDRRRRETVGLVVAVILSVGYTVASFVQPASLWPVGVARAIQYLRWIEISYIRLAWEKLESKQYAFEIGWGIYFALTAGVVPWLVLLFMRRGRPHDLGLRLPNRIGLRVLGVGYLLALPFQVWMVRSPTFAPYYTHQFVHRGAVAFLAYYAVVILAEHFFFHGVLLATCRRGLRWPAPPPQVHDAAHRFGRVLQWFGLAQPVDGARGLTRLTRWIGLPGGCVTAVVASGLLFAAVHLGKDRRELLLSLPGGLLLGYVAYRGNTLLIPFLLHAATAGTALALMLAAQ